MAEHQAEVSASARELAREVLIHGPDLAGGARSPPRTLAGEPHAAQQALPRPRLVHRGVRDRAGRDRPTGQAARRAGRLAPLRRREAHRRVGLRRDHRPARRRARPGGAHGSPGTTSTPSSLRWPTSWRSSATATGAEVSGLGVSIGGNVADQRVVTRAPFLGWRDVALAERLERELGMPVTVENDVTALTTAEQWFGAVRGRPAFAVVTIGAGVGYGLVVHDRVITTPDSGLGLGGHLPLDPNGPLCGDGHRGCSTAMLSIPSITAQLGIALGHEVDYDEVLRLAEEGHPLAVSVTTAAGRALGRMMAGIANIAMVDTIVLSGEGVALWNVVGDVALAALAEDRDPEATPGRGARRRRGIRVVGARRRRGGDPGRARAAAAARLSAAAAAPRPLAVLACRARFGAERRSSGARAESTRCARVSARRARRRRAHAQLVRERRRPRRAPGHPLRARAAP